MLIQRDTIPQDTRQLTEVEEEQLFWEAHRRLLLGDINDITSETLDNLPGSDYTFILALAGKNIQCGLQMNGTENRNRQRRASRYKPS